MIERAIRRHLLQDPAIVALVVDRVEPAPPAQASALPVITYDPISLVSDYTLDGEAVGPDTMRLQIDCWSPTFNGAQDLGALVKARLHGKGGVIGDQFIDFIRLTNRRGPRFEADAKVYRETSEFIVHAVAA